MRTHFSQGLACCLLISACAIASSIAQDAPRSASQTDTDEARERKEQRWQEEFPLLHGLQHPDSKSPHALQPLDADRETDPIRKLKVQRYNAALMMCDMWSQQASMAVLQQQHGLAGRPTMLSQDFLEAVNHLTEARLSLADTEEERLKLLEHQFGLLQEFEKQLQILGSRGREGNTASKDLLEVRYARLTAEIELLEAKRRMTAPGSPE